MSQFADMKSSSNFFEVILFLLSSLVTVLGFMSISSLVLGLWQFSVLRDWPEILKWKIPPFVNFPDIWRLEWVRDSKFSTNVSDEVLLNVAKFPGYSFYSFWLIKGKTTETGYQKICNSYTIYIVLLVILFFIIISISSAYIHCYW